MQKGQNFSKEKWSQLGKEGGRVSGMIRRDKILKVYIDIAREEGIYEALRRCSVEQWQRGYGARYRQERRNEEKERQSNLLSLTRRDGRDSRQKVS